MMMYKSWSMILLPIWVFSHPMTLHAEENQSQPNPDPNFFNMEFLEEIAQKGGDDRQPLKYDIHLANPQGATASQTTGKEPVQNIQYEIKLENPQYTKETPPENRATLEQKDPPKEDLPVLAPTVKDAPGKDVPPPQGSVTHQKTTSALAPTSTPPSIMADETIELYQRDSHLIILPEDPIQIFLADPKIAEIQQTNATTLHVQGLNPGATEIVVTGKQSHNLYRYRIKIIPDCRELQNFITQSYNTSSVSVKPLPNGVLLEGNINSSKSAEEIKTLAERFFPEKGAVINRLEVKNNSQINLRVKIAEVNRTVVNRLGINWDTLSHYGNMRFGILNGRIPFDTATKIFASPSVFTDPIKSIGVRFHDGKNDIASLLDMLAQESLATVLAEPNLITSSGEEASFLVGGEFPYPVAQGIGATQTVTFQFKKYGISLSFLPVVMGETISLRVKPEVSDLDDTRTIKQNGTEVPSIRTRRAESTIKMQSGQSMVMAGLLSDQTTSVINAFPGLSDVPILGALFRSDNFKSDKTELVIVVTPYFVDPIDAPTEISLPTDGLKYANFFDMIWRRRINEPKIGDGVQGVTTLSGEAGFYY